MVFEFRTWGVVVGVALLAAPPSPLVSRSETEPIWLAATYRLAPIGLLAESIACGSG